LNEAEYRQHPAISRSELWHIHESPQKFKYLKEHPAEPPPALLFGQAFHKLALEPEAFNEEFVVAPEASRRTKVGKRLWAEFLEEVEGKTAITAEMYAQAVEMCAAIAAEPLAVKLLNGRREVPFFWRDEVTGEECKCRVDCLNQNYSQPIIVDVKSTGDASTEMFTKDAIKYGYDFQSAMYSTGVEANIMERPLFVFIAVEKTPPYAVNILQADELFLRRGEGLYRSFLDIYHDCKQTGHWYGYLGKQNQINSLALPSWLAREVE
jgi:hypothetical protein